MAKAKTTVIVPPLRRTRMKVTIVGTTPLLTSRIPEDAIPSPGPADKTRGKKSQRKTGEELYLESRYMINDRTHGFPGRAVKQAMRGACRLLPDKKLNMTNAAIMFHTLTPDHHEYYKLKFKTVAHSKMYGRNKDKGLIEVHRAMYEGWELEITIDFNEDCLSAQDVVNLLRLAGEVGLGAFRPEKGGTYGQFIVKAGKEKAA